MLVSKMDIETGNVGTSMKMSSFEKYYDADKHSFIKHTFY